MQLVVPKKILMNVHVTQRRQYEGDIILINFCLSLSVTHTVIINYNSLP